MYVEIYQSGNQDNRKVFNCLQFLLFILLVVTHEILS